MTILLSVQGVSKSFASSQALSQVTFDLPEGQILGLVGPKRSGKAILYNIIHGAYSPDEGRIIFRDKDVTHLKSYQRAKLGLARTHEIPRLYNLLSIKGYLFVCALFGREYRKRRKIRHLSKEVTEIINLLGLSNRTVSSLKVLELKHLFLARAIISRPRLLLLDNIFAGLNSTESIKLIESIQQIRKREVTILMIEHDMQAIMKVADRIIVLDYGEQIAEGRPEKITKNEKVIQAYLGDPKFAKKHQLV
jgi:branched-chain amino acid transport system ATP-binding protein